MPCQATLHGVDYDLKPIGHDHTDWFNNPTRDGMANLTWSVNPCGLRHSRCSNDSVVCLEQVITRAGEQVSDTFSLATLGSVREVSAIPIGLDGLMLDYTGEKWHGKPVSAEIQYICGNREHTIDVFFTGSVFKARIESPGACFGVQDAPGSGWVHFSWYWMLLGLFFASFIGTMIVQMKSDDTSFVETVNEVSQSVKNAWHRVVARVRGDRHGYSRVE